MESHLVNSIIRNLCIHPVVFRFCRRIYHLRFCSSVHHIYLSALANQTSAIQKVSTTFNDKENICSKDYGEKALTKLLFSTVTWQFPPKLEDAVVCSDTNVKFCGTWRRCFVI